MIKKGVILVVLILVLSSCTVVKEYEKMNLNDPEMVLADKKSSKYIKIFHSYRESAVGANGGKSGGGCGCN